MTPLHWASWLGKKDIIDDILKSGSNINNRVDSGFSPLHFAVKARNVDIVQQLLTGKVELNCQDYLGLTPLHWTVVGRRSNEEIVEHLLKYGADVNIKDKNGLTPLFLAVKNGHSFAVEQMLGVGVDVNLRDEAGLNSLYWAVRQGYVHIVEKLLRYPTETNTVDSMGLTPLHFALLEGNLELLQKLLENGGKDVYHEVLGYGIHISTTLGYDALTRFLMERREIDCNIRDAFGQTPVHCAARIGKNSIIQELLKDTDIDLKAVDNAGQSVLHIAAIYGYCDLARDCIKRGIEVDATDNLGRTALHYSVLYRHCTVVEFLVNEEASIDCVDRLEKKPVDYLYDCERNSLIFKFLNREKPHLDHITLDVVESFQQNFTALPFSDIVDRPGLGSVLSLIDFDMDGFVDNIKRNVIEVLKDAIPEAAGIRVIGCGSSFERTKTCLPDELDFMVELFVGSERGLLNSFEGFEEMRLGKKAKQMNVCGTYGIWLWFKLVCYWAAQSHSGIVLTGKGFTLTMPLPPQRHPDHKTCTTWIWIYNDEDFQNLTVSIDFVPAIRNFIGSSTARRTWCISKEEILGRECFIVPKIPYERSEITGKFSVGFLSQLGRVSYPTLEVEHILGLPKRIKDVYITSKALRKPEVCGIMVRNRKGQIENISHYLTSYMLKTVFLHLVEAFLSLNLTLGRMVLLVFEYLEHCLEEGQLPMFFEPAVNVLAGTRLSVHDILQVARVMSNNVIKPMYERDFKLASVTKDDQEEEYFHDTFKMFEI